MTREKTTRTHFGEFPELEEWKPEAEGESRYVAKESDKKQSCAPGKRVKE